MKQEPFPAVFAVFFFAGLLSSVSYLLYRMSGWRTLAPLYAAREPYAGPLWRYRTGRVGNTHYRSCLTLGSSAAGLYLSVSPPFGIGYKPLLIPWERVAVSLKKFWFIEYWEFHFGELDSPTLRIGKRLGQEIIRACTKG